MLMLLDLPLVPTCAPKWHIHQNAKTLRPLTVEVNDSDHKLCCETLAPGTHVDAN